MLYAFHKLLKLFINWILIRLIWQTELLWSLQRNHHIEKDLSKCGVIEGSGQMVDVDVSFDSMDYILTETGQCLAVGKAEKKCSSYAYSTSEMNVSITTENNLVCSKGYLELKNRRLCNRPIKAGLTRYSQSPQWSAWQLGRPCPAWSRIGLGG